MKHAECHREAGLARLGDLLAEVRAGFACGERVEGGVVQLRMNNVDTHGRFVWDRFIRVPATAEVFDEYQLRTGDVVFNNTNSTALVGKSALFVEHNEPVVYSNHFTRLRTDRERLDPAYLTWWLNHEWRRGTFAEICNQWIGQSAVKPDKLLALNIPLPPLAEQERIAGWVSRGMEQAAAARRAALDRLAAAEALPAALLREVFEGPQASGWETRTIGEFARTCSGATPSRGNAAYFGGGIPWVKTGELRDGFVGDDGSTEESVTEAALRDCSLPLLPPGTLLIAMYGQGKTRGRTGILTREATTNQACFAILPAPDVFDTGFLQLWFRANYNDLRALTENRGGNQPNLNGVLLRELEIPLPDPTSQRHLAAELTEKLAAAEGVIARCREELAAIEALPAALLRGAFGGNDNGW
ncbi:MAG: restriction endonuclease subunit S [Phycisphaeraceae bacterium]|nr:restriction endonuclease subunit S [Phycisphaeraceae bacterium]